MRKRMELGRGGWIAPAAVDECPVLRRGETLAKRLTRLGHKGITVLAGYTVDRLPPYNEELYSGARKGMSATARWFRAHAVCPRTWPSR